MTGNCACPQRTATACAASCWPAGPTAPGSAYSARAPPAADSSRHSDLDLLSDSPRALPLAAVAELHAAFAESNLPFSVDLLERRDASAEFVSRIESEGMVALNPLPAEHR